MKKYKYFSAINCSITRTVIYIYAGFEVLMAASRNMAV
jgi:hypothetical protein